MALIFLDLETTRLDPTAPEGALILEIAAFAVARRLGDLPTCAIVGPSAHRAQPDVMTSIAKAWWHLSRLTA